MSSPPFVTRSQWGARDSKGSAGLFDASRLSGAAFHWGSGRTPRSHSECARLVRGYQWWHMDHHGWLDLAYNFLYCPHGYVFEGRGWNRRSGANGNGTVNRSHRAFCLIGGNGAFTPAARRAGQWLWNEHLRRNPRATDRASHRRFTGSDCPGPEVLAALRSGWPQRTQPEVDDLTPELREYLDEMEERLNRRIDRTVRQRRQEGEGSLLTNAWHARRNATAANRFLRKQFGDRSYANDARRTRLTIRAIAKALGVDDKDIVA